MEVAIEEEKKRKEKERRERERVDGNISSMQDSRAGDNSLYKPAS